MKSTSRKKIPTLAEPRFGGSARAMFHDRLGLLRRVGNECGDIGQIRLWRFPVVVINKAEYVQAVLVEHANDFDKRPQLPIVRATAGNGLFSAFSRTGEHRRQRKLLQPVFQPRHLVTYTETIVEIARRVADSWQSGQTVGIEREMERITMGVAEQTFFGVDLLNEARELGATITRLFALFGEELQTPWVFPSWVPTPHNRRVRQAVSHLEKTLMPIIQQRREEPSDKEDFLSLLLKARYEDGTPLSEREVRDQAMTMFMAGHETMAVALTWTWYLLSQHPAIYDRAREEVEQAVGERDPVLDDLPQMPLVLQVFKESLRLYPPADIISLRVALRDMEIDGYRIPRGRPIIISPYALHRKTENFPDPETFDPERFTPENEKKLPRCAYLPFGAGARVCIGQHFALMEGHLILAALLQSVRFRLDENQRVEPQAVFTTRPKNDIQMIVEHEKSRGARALKAYDEKPSQPKRL